MRQEQFRSFSFLFAVVALVCLVIIINYFQRELLRNVLISVFVLDIIAWIVLHIVRYRQNQHNSDLDWKPMLSRDVLANLSQDLKVMRFRLAQSLVEENGAIYRKFYESYPELKAIHEQDCLKHEKEIDRQIEHAAIRYNMNVADVRAYLRNFCYLDSYFVTVH